ncbi:jg14455 [Pararge aegeria aegeria]|uniref:Jg14455 protein n=1 Tax=Pararge aegeria aegeria TaxID=348720 RepID=A0A8S4QF78_9NEOP|nr:jg14455 [Pararge aegeria aegeria]
MTYGSELRAMRGVCLRYQVRNEEIRRSTRVTGIALRVAKLNRRTLWSQGAEWRPRTDYRSVGTPPTRWTDDIKRVAGSRCTQAGYFPLNKEHITKYSIFLCSI